MYKAPGNCPVCGNGFKITQLSCKECGSELSGEYEHCKFCSLPEQDLNFIEVFIKNRGSIKDVEKELGISYPTVRSKLDNIIIALGFNVDPKPEKKSKEERVQILDRLEKGEISIQEATELLKNNV